jgi:hypothetical protein
MSEWVEGGHIERFIEQTMGGMPPVFWSVDQDLERYEDLRRLRDYYGNDNVRLRSESSALEIKLDGERSFNSEIAEAIILGLDSRLIELQTERLPSGVSLIVQTQVPQDRDNVTYLDAIGPGGKALLFETASRRAVDITVRRRGYAFEGRWRDRFEILHRLNCDCGNYYNRFPEFMVKAKFGYLELSKYESQTVLRPVFLFVITQDQGGDGSWPAWRSIFVEPATTSPEVSLDEGVGSWSEQ